MTLFFSRLKTNMKIPIPIYKTSNLQSLIEACVENAIRYQAIKLKFPKFSDIHIFGISFNGSKTKGRYNGYLDGYIFLNKEIDGIGIVNKLCYSRPIVSFDSILIGREIDIEHERIEKNKFILKILDIFKQLNLTDKEEYQFRSWFYENSCEKECADNEDYDKDREEIIMQLNDLTSRIDMLYELPTTSKVERDVEPAQV